MFRKLMLAATIGALATPALADTAVTVNIGGLDAKAAHEVIYRAAQAACRNELATETALTRFYVRPDCISNAVATAEAKLEAMRGLASR